MVKKSTAIPTADFDFSALAYSGANFAHCQKAEG
jgi:hypothetical protein